MFLILDSRKRIVEICEHPCYVRRQTNSVVILSDWEHADAIYSNDTDSFWPMEKMGYLCESHTMVEVDHVPPEVVAGYWFYHAGEFYTTEQDLSALAKAKAPETASIVFVKLAEDEQLDDVTLTEHAEQFSQWTFPVHYKVKGICRYNGKLYRCLTEHDSQETWTPEGSPSLWKEIGDPIGEWPAWSRPIGATDTYGRGDKVSHNGKCWTSDYENNVWEPGIFGWKQITNENEEEAP